MYGEYWKLDTLPFENNCDPQFFFRAATHEAAVLKLQYVIEQGKGAAILVGGHGLGKTYLTRVLESVLPDAFRPVIRLLFPQLSPAQTLRLVARRLGAVDAESEPSADDATVVRRLEDRLQQLASEGSRPVLVIDDAHTLDSPQALSCLAQLLGASEICGLGLSLVLCGQPELLPQVQRVPALHERVAVRIAVHALSPAETTAYVRHRLSVAGLDECMFDAEALWAVATLSHGVPRRINQLCDLALLVGYADELSTLHRDDIEAADEELTQVSAE